MSTKKLIQDLGIQHLSVRDVLRLEEALDTADLETVLAIADDLVGRAAKQRQQPKPQSPKADNEPTQVFGIKRKSKGVTEGHRVLIRLLAEQAVEEYLAEQEADT
jgi:hypothetical protein